MPVLWGLDHLTRLVFHSTRLVVISVRGVVHLNDMEECVDGIMTSATMSYRKLVDLSEGQPVLSREDFVALSEYVREHSSTGPQGALAINAGPEEGEQQARLFESLSLADRPLMIFREPQAARA